MHGFFHESFDGDIIIVDLSFFDQTSPRNFWYSYTQSHLILKIVELGMETSELFFDDVVLFLNDFKLFQLLFLSIESWP